MTAQAPNRLRLPRAMRLQQAREFTKIRAEGRRMGRGCLVANWMVLPEGRTSQVGVVTSRKLGNATVRSRARRLLRETFRLHQYEFKRPVAVVLVARPSIAGKKLPEVERDFLAILHEAKLLKTGR